MPHHDATQWRDIQLALDPSRRAKRGLAAFPSDMASLQQAFDEVSIITGSSVGSSGSSGASGLTGGLFEGNLLVSNTLVSPKSRAQLLGRTFSLAPALSGDMHTHTRKAGKLGARTASLAPARRASSLSPLARDLMPSTAAQFVATTRTRDQFAALTNGGRLPDHASVKLQAQAHALPRAVEEGEEDEDEDEDADGREGERGESDNVEYSESLVPLHALRACIALRSEDEQRRFFERTVPTIVALVLRIGPELFPHNMYVSHKTRPSAIAFDINHTFSEMPSRSCRLFCC
jgi:hypothetical protein